MPETIPVVMTGEAKCKDILPQETYPIVHIDFKEYVKGVLPNEWGPKWNEESLKAGAVAVKMFAISMVERRGYVWDCNWSQVYRPSRRTEATDKAVDDTWDYILLKDDKVFTTYYDDYLATCYMRGALTDCMGQWNSLADAEAGMNFKDILYKYYKGSSVISLTTEKKSTNTITKLRLLEDTLYIKYLKEEHR